MNYFFWLFLEIHAFHSFFQDGSFLVRKSSGQDSKQPYTLVVFYNKRVYNIPIRFIESERQYALGREKTGEEVGDLFWIFILNTCMEIWLHCLEIC